MTLTDAGPILAMLDRGDPQHGTCVAAARSLARGPLLTTWPCFAEAMYLLGRSGGFRLQSGLWALHAAGRVAVDDLTQVEVGRTAALMEQYRDTPMDLGDATLVAVAEARSLRRIFTLDRHFWAYRLADGSALEPVPAR